MLLTVEKRLSKPAVRAAVCCRGLTKEFGTGAARVRALRGIDV